VGAPSDLPVLIIGAGIGGLTTALELERVGIPCRLIDAVEAFEPLGVGINVLPHAARRLTELGLGPALSSRGVRTRESAFFNRFGQLAYREPTGLEAGHEYPQYSIHRGDLHRVLLDAVLSRLGPAAVLTGTRAVGVTQDEDSVKTAVVSRNDGPSELRSSVVIGADGIHSAVRAQFYPDEGAPRYSGVMMWRGSVAWRPFLSGATMVRAGWFPTGKLVVYPIRDNIDDQGRQLVNWVAEVEMPQRTGRDWTRRGALADFAQYYADWHFDWLDVPAMLAATETILEYPMVDQDPLPRWTHGRVTLLGDAAHPMVPRGSNGAGQAILDAEAVALHLLAHRSDPAAALEAYEQERRTATTAVVLTNRKNPPDAILREVYTRTGDRRFERLEDFVSERELREIADNYRRVAGVNVHHHVQDATH
jgi:2-polyprenyl-6-methoxyphenol hydroxylase-like FAD-dependent oxidoreductase